MKAIQPRRERDTVMDTHASRDLDAADLLLAMAAAACNVEPGEDGEDMRTALFGAPSDFVACDFRATDPATGEPVKFPIDRAVRELNRTVLVRWSRLRNAFKNLPSVTDEVVASNRLVQWVLSSVKYMPVSVSVPPPAVMGACRLYVIKNEDSEEFAAAKKRFGARLAFHGSPFHNWHSILRSGLRVCSGTNLQCVGAKLGAGIYVGANTNVSMQYAKSSRWDWRMSMTPKSSVCMALCEVVDHPSVIRASCDHTWMYCVPYEGHVALRCLFVYRSRSDIPADVAAEHVFDWPFPRRDMQTFLSNLYSAK